MSLNWDKKKVLNKNLRKEEEKERERELGKKKGREESSLTLSFLRRGNRSREIKVPFLIC